MLVSPTSFTVAAYASIAVALIAGGLMFVDVLGRRHYSRLPLYASVTVLMFESLLCFFAASDEWTEQWLEGSVVGIYSEHVRFAIEFCAIGGLTVLVSIVLLLGRWRRLWWLAIAMQVGIFALALLESQVIDPNAPGWLVFSRVPLAAALLLFGVQIAQRTLKSRLAREVTVGR